MRFGTRLKFSTAVHSQIDGQSERTIQTLEDILRVCTLDFPGSWAKKVPLMEFVYNYTGESFGHLSTSMKLGKEDFWD